jgi:hypothetical protein
LSHIKICGDTRWFTYWILLIDFLYLHFWLLFLFKKLLITSHTCLKELLIFDFINAVPICQVKIATIFILYFVCLFLFVWGYSTRAYLVLMIYYGVFILDIWNIYLIICHIFIYQWNLTIIWLIYKFVFNQVLYLGKLKIVPLGIFIDLWCSILEYDDWVSVSFLILIVWTLNIYINTWRFLAWVQYL